MKEQSSKEQQGPGRSRMGKKEQEGVGRRKKKLEWAGMSKRKG